MKSLHPAAVEFIEKMSLLAASAGLPRIGGRIVGLLVVLQEPLSFDRIAALLHTSRGSVSTNMRLLESRGVIRRVSHLGERKDLFELDPSYPERMLERSLETQRAIGRVAGQARHDIPDEFSRSKDALRLIEEFATDWVEATERALGSWHRTFRQG